MKKLRKFRACVSVLYRSVFYDPDGGSDGPVSPEYYLAGSPVGVASQKPVRSGYDFVGWWYDGTITVRDLTAGEYYWVEIRSAEGYTLDPSKHTFRVSGGRTTELSIANTRTPVPEVFSGDHYAYIIGYGDGAVHPNANITRGEFAAIAARFDFHGTAAAAAFDDTRGHWAQEEIDLAYSNGWIMGYENGSYQPDRNITRAEAVTLINRVLQRVPESTGDLLSGMVSWPDNMDTTKWYYLAVQEATNSHEYSRKENGYEYWTELKKVRDWAALEK